MNVQELNPQGYLTLARFFEVMLPLTLATVWIIVAFQSKFVVRDDRGGTMWKKLLWPVMLVNNIIPRRKIKNDDQEYEFPIQRP